MGVQLALAVAETALGLLGRARAKPKIGPQNLLRDLILLGGIPAGKVDIVRRMKPVDQRRLLRRIEEWVKEIVAPGTGQPVFAILGALPGEPLQATAAGSPLLEPVGLPFGPRGRRQRRELDVGRFQRQAAELRRLAVNRGLI